MSPAPLTLAILAASTQLAAGDGWVVGGTPLAMVRKLDSVTLEYRVNPGDSNSFRLTVDPCGDGHWSMKDSLELGAYPPKERAGFLRRTIDEDFRNARLNCTLPDGIEGRMIAGFDDAFAKFDKLDK